MFCLTSASPWHSLCLASGGKIKVNTGYGKELESRHYLEQKDVRNQVSFVLLLLMELFVFQRSVCAMKVRDVFFCGQALSFLSGGFGLCSKQEKRNRFV